MIHLVVANCNDESVDWTESARKSIPDCLSFLSVFERPLGREARHYLDHIVSLYDEIQDDDELIFLQGNPFNHDPELLEHIKDSSIRYYGLVVKCDPSGLPHCDWTPLHAWSDVLKLPKKDDYAFVAGAQYRVTGKQIKSQTKEFYLALLNLTTIPNNKSAWVLERLWPVIWQIEL